MCRDSKTVDETDMTKTWLRRERSASDILEIISLIVGANVSRLDSRENRCCESHLLHLAKHIQAKVSYYDSSYVDPAGSCLDSLENEQEKGSQKRGIPRYHLANKITDQRSNCRIKHSYKTKKPNNKTERGLYKLLIVLVRIKTAYVE